MKLPLLCLNRRRSSERWLTLDSAANDFREVSDGLIDVLISFARRIPDPQTEIAFAQLGEAVTRVSQDAAAYTHRDAQFVLNVHGRWDSPANDTKCIG